MRRVVFALLVTGCGRIGFDGLSHDSATDGLALSIDHTKVAGDLVDFPVLIELHVPALGADPAPLRFYAGGALLAHEIEQLTPQGDLLAWVKVPALSSSIDTELLLTSSEVAAPPPENVWSNNFTNVHHWGIGGSLDASDSTGVNDGVLPVGPQSAAGKIGGALRLAATPAVKANAVGMDNTAGGRNTVSYWVDMKAPAQKSPISMSFTDCGTNCDYDIWFFSDNCVGFNTTQGEVLGSTRGQSTDRWLHVAAIFFNGVPSAATNELYFDGEPQPLTMCQPGAPISRTAGGPVYWGSYRGYEMTGFLDESRIARGARSAAWIKTEYANQNDPTTFVRVK